MISPFNFLDIEAIVDLYNFQRATITVGVVCDVGFVLVGDLRMYSGIIGDPKYMKACDVTIYTNHNLKRSLTKLKEVSILGV